MLGRVLLWSDSLAHERGAPAYAHEWGERLHCPVQSLGTCEPVHDAATAAADDLVVFDRHLLRGVTSTLLQKLGRQEACLLACPEQWQPLSRLLVIHEDGDADGAFLRSAVRLGLALQARPIVLTVARTERGAFRRGWEMREALTHDGLDCDFDQLAGVGVGPATLHVACWRQCQVVVVKRRSGRWWWPWRRGDSLAQLTASPSSLAFLALPQDGVPDLPSPARRDSAAAPGLASGSRR
jgi:hypothetical protein